MSFLIDCRSARPNTSERVLIVCHHIYSCHNHPTLSTLTSMPYASEPLTAGGLLLALQALSITRP